MRQLRAGQRNIGQALIDNALERVGETLRICHHAIVETERLLVKVAEQMKRFDRHVGALDGALQEAPEVFEPVGVDIAFGVALGMVDDVVDVGVLGRQMSVPSVRS